MSFGQLSGAPRPLKDKRIGWMDAVISGIPGKKKIQGFSGSFRVCWPPCSSSIFGAVHRLQSSMSIKECEHIYVTQK